MAAITIDLRTGWPICTGCGELLEFVPWLLDSRIRVPYQGDGASSAAQIAEFAREHRHCRPPRVTVSGDVVITDRRGSY